MNKLLGLLALIMLCVLCSVQRSTSTYRTKNQMSFHKAPLIADLEVGEKIVVTGFPAKYLKSWEPSVEEPDKIVMLNNGSYIHMNKKANKKAK